MDNKTDNPLKQIAQDIVALEARRQEHPDVRAELVEVIASVDRVRASLAALKDVALAQEAQRTRLEASLAELRALMAHAAEVESQLRAA